MTDQTIRDRLESAARPLGSRPISLKGIVDRRERRQRRERMTAGAVAVTLTAAIVAGGFLTMGKASAPRGTATAGGATVHVPALAAGQFLYRKAIGVGIEGQAVETTWWATDGSGARRADCTAPPSQCWVGSQGTFGPGAFPSTVGDVSGLSTDPTTLLQQLEQRIASGESPEPQSSGTQMSPGVSAGSLWLAVSNLAAASSGGPDLKAALFQVATQIPGVDVQTGVTDPIGRPAVALSLGDPSTGAAFDILYFDPDTAQLIADRIAPTASGGPSGYQVIESGIVDSTSSVPSGDQWLSPPISGTLPSPPSQP
jgi:hypothetical protein